MAGSPAHKFGQIIGDLLEGAVEPSLRDVARRHHLYLDRRGNRPARAGRKVSWTDEFGNVHDLDYVLERGGTAEQIGTPVAFIEVAWHRYTKHSRNKAQEIQGAVLPLVSTHRRCAPFIGLVLAGVFTEGALTQLRSLGFALVYFPYDTVVEAFRAVAIDAWFDESTSEAEFRRKVRAWEKLPRERQERVARNLVELNMAGVESFVSALERAVARHVRSVRVLPLHGAAAELASAEDAVAFIEAYRERQAARPVVKYEIEVRYDNGDRIEAHFGDKHSAIEFLRGFLSPHLTPANGPSASADGR